MSKYGSYVDSPDKIKSEGQTIVLKFIRDSETTGTIEWTLPDQTVGCDPETMAYNGIVITIDQKAVEQSTRPIDGTLYTPDPTADVDLHAGDSIGEALVIFAGYGDKTTDSFSVTDLDPNTSYYVSGYAVDAQHRYHTRGTHAYSLPFGNKEALPTPAYQVLQLGVEVAISTFDVKQQIVHVSGVKGTEPTGLDTSTTYCFKMAVDDEKDLTEYFISGADAQTYDELIVAINKAIIDEEGYSTSSSLPNAGALWFNGQYVYEFTGDQLVQKRTIISDTDPTVTAVGDLWFDDETQKLYEWDGAQYVEQPYYSLTIPLNQSAPQGFTLLNLVDETVFVREGDVWCEHPLVISDTAPNAVGEPNAHWFWLDAEGFLFKWDIDCSGWVDATAVVSDYDPTALAPGFFWVDTTNTVLNQLDNSSPPQWAEYVLGEVSFTSKSTTPTANDAFVDVENQTIEIFNGTDWVEQLNVIFFGTDPSDINSCDTWVDTSGVATVVKVWDSMSGVWAVVDTFWDQELDPYDPAPIEKNTYWYNNEQLFVWDLVQWIAVDYYEYDGDPTSPAVGDFYRNPETEIFYRWDGAAWVAQDVIETPDDPNTVNIGDYWVIPNPVSVSVWNGISWISVATSTNSPVPQQGYRYYNDVDQVLYEWNGREYIEVRAKAYTILNVDGNITFLTSSVGSEAFICVEQCVIDDLIRSLSERTNLLKGRPGTDPISGKPSYDTIGVGTDGSDDERKALIRALELRLGAPLAVELTKEQYETAIRLSLEKFRQLSASAYDHGFMFLDLEPGVQTYQLTSHKHSFNKVIEVMGAFRIQSSFLGNAAGQGAYGQAMLQHLYQMGTFDLISYHIISDYVELMNRLFAANLTYTWIESSRTLAFHQSFGSNETVLLDVAVERTEQDLMKDRYCKPWIENYALAQAMLMLSEYRGKYASLPGAGGGVTLNAQDLKVRGAELIQECLDDIDNYVANEIEKFGGGTMFVRG